MPCEHCLIFKTAEDGVFCAQHLRNTGEKPKMTANPDASCQICEIEPMQLGNQYIYVCDYHRALYENGEHCF